jgi:MFS family permease
VYTFTNLPAIVSCVVGGVVIDRWGVALCTVLFLSCMLLANLGFFLAVLLGTQGSAWWYSALLLARALLGTFGENSLALQSVILSCYVDVSRLTLFLGLGVNGSWMFEALNNVLTPHLYHVHGSALAPAAFGLALSALSWVVGLLLVWYEKRLYAQKQQFIVN